LLVILSGMLRYLFLIALMSFGFLGMSQSVTPVKKVNCAFSAVVMDLSAFGVESDDFPSIHVFIDLINDTSLYKKSYYNPKYKPSVYRLSNVEIKKIIGLLNSVSIEKLRKSYKINITDQPSSTTIIYRGERKFVIEDYGLSGDYPLPV